MGLIKRFKKGMESRREKYREDRTRKGEEAYLRDVDELRRIRREERMLDVRLRKQKAGARVGKKRRQMSSAHRIGGRVLDIGANIGEHYVEGPTRKEPAKKKKKKAAKKKPTKKRAPPKQKRRESVDSGLFPY